MLSICIPTYNRFQFLKWTLERTIKDFPHAEIIISDNASTDDTRTMQVNERCRYIRQSTNIGPFPNMRAALLASHTKYCTFLGDDDYLLPDEVQKGIDFLEANPRVSGYYAPCQLYDEVEGKADAYGNAFYVADDTTYNRADALWNFVITKHVWPEHVIWRREWLEHIMLPRLRAYWCFVDLAHAFGQGPVHFAKNPFYRNITNHPIGRRMKLGDGQALTEFDSYRGGLENMAFELFRKDLDKPGIRETINNGVRLFTFMRVQVAYRLLEANGALAEAQSYAKRLQIMKFDEMPPLDLSSAAS